MDSETLHWGDTPFISPSDIILIKRVSEGSFGTVYKAIYMYQTVAVKVFRPQRIARSLDSHDSASDSSNAPLVTQMEQEVRILRNLRHKNVVGFLGAVRDPLAIVMDYCESGSLWDVLRRAEKNKKVWRKLAWTRRINLLLGAAQGMAFVHEQLGTKPAILHRDLKSPNVLLDKDWVVKIADFGLSRFVENDLNSLWDMMGTNPTWMAPEVLENASHNQHEFTQCADVYPMGIIMWELMTLTKPWCGPNDTSVLPGAIFARVVFHKKRPPIPEDPYALPGVRGRRDAVDRYIKLMCSCWSSYTNKRPSYMEIVQELQHIKDLFMRRPPPCLNRMGTLRDLTGILNSLKLEKEDQQLNCLPITYSFIQSVLGGTDGSYSQQQEGASFLSIEPGPEGPGVTILSQQKPVEETDDSTVNRDILPQSAQVVGKEVTRVSPSKDSIPGFDSPFDKNPLLAAAIYPAGPDPSENPEPLVSSDSPRMIPSPFDNPDIQCRPLPPPRNFDASLG